MDEAIAVQRANAKGLDELAQKEIAASGTQITELTAEEHALFREKLIPIREPVKEKGGSEKRLRRFSA